MKVSDTLIGAVLLVLSVAVVWHVRSFPAIPGQPYGAALFPLVVGVGLGIASLILIVTSLGGLRRAHRPATDSVGEPVVTGAPAQSTTPQARPAAFAATLGALVLYPLLADWLGFLICSVLMLCAMLWTYGVRPVLVLPVAIGATLAIHTVFYKFLKVPLPWGLLQPMAW